MSSLSHDRNRRLGWVSRSGVRIAFLFAVLVFLLPILPRMAMGVLIVLGIVALSAQKFRVSVPENWLSSDSLSLVLLAFSAYLLINASWSLDLRAAYMKAIYFVIVLVILHVAMRWIAEADRDVLQIAVAGVAIGAAVASSYLLIEIVTEQGLKRWAYTMFPAIRPSGDKHVDVLNGVVTSVGAYHINRNIANLMLLFWPLALLLLARLSALKLALAISALAGLWALISLSSYHETSAIAFLVSLLVFLVFRISQAMGRWCVMAAWCASVVLVVPAAILAHQAGLHHAEWLPSTARARIILWDVTAREVIKAPILGVGIRSTRVLDAQNPNRNIWHDGEAYPRRTGRHAHNIYLQTWYELGAVGAAFLLIIGLLVLRKLSRLAAPLQPFAFSASALIFVLAAFSWGMWQSWYVSSLATGMILLAMALAYAGKSLVNSSAPPT